jgi:hypothetical protein
LKRSLPSLENQVGLFRNPTAFKAIEDTILSRIVKNSVKRESNRFSLNDELKMAVVWAFRGGWSNAR